MTVFEFVSAVSSGSLDPVFRRLYGNSDMELLRQRARWLSAAEQFSRLYPEREEVHVFSAPGHTVIGGNHIDHRQGCVLAAAVTEDILAVIGFHNEGIIRIKSEGDEAFSLDPGDLGSAQNRTDQTSEIVCGVLSELAENGIMSEGFDAFITSDIQSVGGSSYSAALGVLIGIAMDNYYNGRALGILETAGICHTAENRCTSKNSEPMEQTVCAVGGVNFIDFKDTEKPLIGSIQFDFEMSGYSLCLIDTGNDHSDLGADYSEISADMRQVSELLGRKCLRFSDEDEFYDKLPYLREKCSDRALLRAIYFFDENRRASEERDALSHGFCEDFFRLVNESGDSTAFLLQNLYSAKDRHDPELMLGIAMSKRFLRGGGAVRVHEGILQAFLPTYSVKAFAAELDRIFGDGSCKILGIRPVGAVEIEV